MSAQLFHVHATDQGGAVTLGVETSRLCRCFRGPNERLACEAAKAVGLAFGVENIDRGLTRAKCPGHWSR